MRDMNAPSAGDTSVHLQDQQILVVEDEHLLAMEMAAMLEAAGATVVGPVPSIEQALSKLDSTHVDVAVLDVSLKGETVFPLADELDHRKIPFVFTTGYDAHALPAAYRDRPRCTKPCDDEEIQRAIDTALKAVH